MKLGFYSHLPIALEDDKIYMPAYMGLYADGLAQLVERFSLIAHIEEYDKSKHDYQFKSGNIEILNLGEKAKAPKRLFTGYKFLRTIKSELTILDHVIVRAPTPLVPWFKYYVKSEKLHYLLVGDEKEGARFLQTNSFRQKLLNRYLLFSDWTLERSIKKTRSFINSPALQMRYEKAGVKTSLISTTILDENDLKYRTNACENEHIQLLYTGRIDISKGLADVLEAMSMLLQKGVKTTFHVVGWEEGSSQVVDVLKVKAEKLGLQNNIIFHGKKRIGQELNQFYQDKDIYLMPSYHEGFPRTLWEAMANGIPIIASKVGAIPHMLTDKMHAILIDPKKPDQIAKAIYQYHTDKNLKNEIVNYAFEMAQEFTMQKQHKRIIEILKQT